VTVFNEHSSNISVTLSIQTTYIAGTAAAATAANIAARGLMTALFTGANSCVLSGTVY
jgi:hypothetical protein